MAEDLTRPRRKGDFRYPTIDELKNAIFTDGGPTILLSDDFRRKVEAGEVYPHTVWGLDVYISEAGSMSAIENEQLDMTRPCPYSREFGAAGMGDAKYFSSRHYEVVDLRVGGERISCSDIAEVIGVLKEAGANGIGEWDKEGLLQEDEETAYVVTPLSETELGELMRGPQ